MYIHTRTYNEFFLFILGVLTRPHDGYFEKVAERISSVLTDEIKRTILQLKNETPESEKIMGVEYYQAVIRDGVRTYAGFEEWRKEHPVGGVLEWMP